MTVEQERICADFIKTEYVYKKKIFNKIDLSEMIRAFYYEQLHPNATRSRTFKANQSFVTRWMKKWGFISNRGKVTRQKNIKDKTLVDAQLFLASAARGYRQYGSTHVICMDETWWPLVPKQQQLVSTADYEVNLIFFPYIHPFPLIFFFF